MRSDPTAATPSPAQVHSGMTRGLTLLFAVVGGAAVGNLYWAQPLLGVIADDLDVSTGTAGWLVTATQLGYAVGILLLVHHIDHCADLAVLPMTSWVCGRTELIRVAGPPPTAAAFASLLDGFSEDLRCRTVSTGRPDFRPMVSVTDIDRPGLVFRDDEVAVRAALVNHPPFTHALAYRIDTASGSVVVSGDTTPCDELVALADGADVLIHEVVHPLAIERYQHDTNATTIAQHMVENHTMVDQVGKIAAAARVDTLVLSHLVPHEGIDDDEWRAAVGDDFTGRVIVGRDLLTIELDVTKLG